MLVILLRRGWHDGRVSHSVIVIFLLALAGFLVGGAVSTWKNNRVVAVALGVCAVLAAVGAFTWWG